MINDVSKQHCESFRISKQWELVENLQSTCLTNFAKLAVFSIRENYKFLLTELNFLCIECLKKDFTLNHDKILQIYFLGVKRHAKIKVLTTLVGQLSLSVGWENGPEWGHKTVSLNFL